MLVLNLNTRNAHIYNVYLSRVVRLTRKGKIVIVLTDGRKAVSDGKFTSVEEAEKLILG
jgi:hypothetical protein